MSRCLYDSFLERKFTAWSKAITVLIATPSLDHGPDLCQLTVDAALVWRSRSGKGCTPTPSRPADCFGSRDMRQQQLAHYAKRRA